MRVYEENNRLVIADGTLTLWLEPWGENSFRVRMTKEAQMDAHDWALTEEVKMCPLQVECKEVDTTDPWYKGGSLQNIIRPEKFTPLKMEKSRP